LRHYVQVPDSSHNPVRRRGDIQLVAGRPAPETEG
jgi:hypothetical protein